MKKIIPFLLFPLLALPLGAQIQHGLKGTYILDSFPVVSFVWNTANPEDMNPSQFALYEGNEAVEFKVEALPIDKSKEVNKNILILWEDMASHGRQSDFTCKMLTRFFSEASFASTDRFEVAVFDRQKDTEKNIIKPLVGEFSTDVQRLSDAVASHVKNSRQYQNYPQLTDLYSAINEGIDLLPNGRSNVIIVVTAGLNMKASGASTEMETVRRKAFSTSTPIYVVKYPLAGNTPEVNTLAAETFGQVISSTIDIASATDSIKQCYLSLDNRLRGRDYKFTFTTKCERDGKPHPLRLSVDKLPPRPINPPFIAPDKNFGQWLADSWWIVAIVVVIVIGTVVLLFFSSEKKKKEQEQANQDMREQFRQQQQESENRSREMVESLRREQEDHQRLVLAEAERAKKDAEEKRLTKLMQTKNLLPRLQCKAGTDSFIYNISKPHITIGRDASNDVAFQSSNDSFNNQTVSGVHAEIVFNGSAFEVFNRSRSYAQGIIVNGQFYQQYTLRNGDMIGIGEAIIIFYI